MTHDKKASCSFLKLASLVKIHVQILPLHVFFATSRKPLCGTLEAKTE